MLYRLRHLLWLYRPLCLLLLPYWTKGIFGVEHPSGSNPTLAAETRVTGTSFLQFEDRCGASFVMMTLMRGGMESADAVPPIFFDEITIDETSQARLGTRPLTHLALDTLCPSHTWPLTYYLDSTDSLTQLQAWLAYLPLNTLARTYILTY